MSKLLLIAFNEDEVLQGAGFCQEMAIPFDVLILKGKGAKDLGAQNIFEANLQEVPPADATALIIKNAAASYTHIAATSSMQSKDIMARFAGLWEASMITDVIEIRSQTEFKRPIIAGTLIATVQVKEMPVVITFRSSNFKTAKRTGESCIQEKNFEINSKTKRISESLQEGVRPDLAQAKVVVSGGRPLKNAENFEKLIGGLADKLGGAAGATRAAVDSHIAANELQIGQTGKIVAPDLYIAAGISGSTQHIAGIKDSKTIVAINTDPDAPIFEVADIGIVADLYQAIPEMIKKI